MSENPRALVFLCECGPIIRDIVDLDALGTAAASMEGVGAVERHSTLCSAEGREWIAAKLSEHPGMRPVFAACTPREHAETLAKACQAAGVNPFLAARANIREQCAWVTPDRAEATRKATDLVSAAVARALVSEPLEALELDCATDVLVIGAGVAGMTAARLLADAGRHVTLVEREPAIGGKVVLYGELFPDLDCAPCLVEPLMDEVLHHENIEVLTSSEVDGLLGYLGNFTARIRVDARHVDPESCFACRACSEACPVEVPDPREGGRATRKAIGIPFAGALPNASALDESVCLRFTGGECEACASACPFGAIDLEQEVRTVERSVGAVIVATGSDLDAVTDGSGAFGSASVLTTYEFERILNPDGPTGGEIRLPGADIPTTIALVHCCDENGAAPARACSRTCCQTFAKQAHLVAEKAPDTRIVQFTFDAVLGGDHFRDLTAGAHRPANLDEIAFGVGDTLRIEPAGQGADIVWASWGSEHRLHADLVVAAPPQRGAVGTAALADTLGIPIDENGFVLVDNRRIRAFASRVAGVFVAGCAESPQDVTSAASGGAAAAGAVLSSLVEGRRLVREATTAWVDSERCGGCALCVLSCPYKAISFDTETRRALVNEALCHGCGTCAATCPSSAISAKGFTDIQLTAEIHALSSTGPWRG